MWPTDKKDYRDISIVVQGAIAGLPTDKPEARHTRICLESIRKVLPGAKIILSTWEGSNTEGLDYDELVISKDPGVSAVCDSPNGFRQIVSSFNGLKKCTTKYAMKTRSDLVFHGANLLDYFLKFNELPFDNQYRILDRRVVTFSSINPRRGHSWPFAVSDWMFFGLTKDVQNIFDIPIDHQTWLPTNEAPNNLDDKKGLFCVEQYIWLSFLGKYRRISCEYLEDVSHDNIATSERYFANNCIFLTARQMGINWLKRPNGAYAQDPWMATSSLYTANDYKKMLNKYAEVRLMIIPNPLEEVVYFTAQHIRAFIKKHIPSLHKTLVHIAQYSKSR
ncbi:MAG: WavE lipopolysaccharide synthesis family protein [Candidatus Pacebacteria bacterium]|nr:WavE lipopolysaccharide synthesis family protein [Candidatus Paceibacterota bacterium]